MSKKTVLIFSFLLLNIFLYSQITLIDSLKTELYIAKEDTTKLKIYNRIGDLFYYDAQFDSAFVYYKYSLHISEKNNDYKKIIIAQNDMANCLYWTSFWREADSLFSLSKKLAIKINDSNLIASSCMGYAMNKLKLNDTLEAVENLKFSLKICNKNNKSLIGKIYANLGQIKRNSNELDSAMYYFEKSKEIWIEINNLNSIARVLFEEGQVYSLQKEYKKAVNLFKKSINQDLLDSINNNKSVFVWKYKRLSDAYLELKMYDSAYFYYYEHSMLYRQIYNEDMVDNIADLELKYEVEKKELILNQQKALIKQQKFKNIVLLIVLFLVFSFMVFAFIILKQIKNKNHVLLEQKEEIETQKLRLENQKEELISTNDQLTNIMQFKENMTQMIVHDLKNPLNRIINYTNNSGSNVDKNQVVSISYRMLNLVENILSYAKYQNMKMNIKEAKINILDVIKNAHEQTEFLFSQKNIEFKIDIVKKYEVWGDKEILSRVFVNLFSNAVKYTPVQGKVLVIVAEIGGLLNIKVKDNGSGITNDKISHIFDIYKQVNKKNENNISSTGIGFTFCKNAIETHGSHISATSEIKVGSIFSFNLKIANINDNIIPDDKITNTEFSFTPTDKNTLNEFALKLLKLEIYEITAINYILKSIDETSEEIKKWKEKITLSVYNNNVELYKTLINNTLN